MSTESTAFTAFLLHLEVAGKSLKSELRSFGFKELFRVEHFFFMTGSVVGRLKGNQTGYSARPRVLGQCGEKRVSLSLHNPVLPHVGPLDNYTYKNYELRLVFF